MQKAMIFATALMAVFSSNTAQADDLGYIVPSPAIIGTPSYSVKPMTLGWTFEFRGNYGLGGLGLLDTGAPGFVAAHEVALWDAGGNKLLSVIIDPTTPVFGGIGMGNLGFKYTLPKGIYTLSASNLGTGDGFLLTYPNNFYTTRYIRPLGARWAPGPAAQFPNLASSEWRFGPAIWFAVPEPASWTLLTLGFGVVGAALRRRAGAAPA